MQSRNFNSNFTNAHAPCKDCPNRHKACWGDCEAYKQYKRDIANYYDARRKYLDYEYTAIEPYNKKRKKREW